MSVRVLHGDCLAIMPTLSAESVHAIVTDPAAGISFMGKDWDRDKGGRDQWVAWMREIAAECLRVAKPGAHALVWALPRTSHWTATAWEDAGWQVRERVSHLFGTGFPKSLDVSKALDRMAGAEREVVGVTGRCIGPSQKAGYRGTGTFRESDDNPGNLLTAPATEAARQWQGWGTAMKPACEDWWLLRKPLAESTVAANVLAHGVGAINVDACRVPVAEGDERCGGFGKGKRPWQTGDVGSNTVYVGADVGRFPANVTHDGSDEVMAAFAAFGERQSGGVTHQPKRSGYAGFREGRDDGTNIQRDPDTGTAARFFYCAKASARDRAGSKHPTVKNVALMRWLCRLIVPPGGTVLDPFAGSGTTLQAAIEEGFAAIGIEQEAEYHADILRRLDMMRADAPLLLAEPE